MDEVCEQLSHRAAPAWVIVEAAYHLTPDDPQSVNVAAQGRTSQALGMQLPHEWLEAADEVAAWGLVLRATGP
jgi:hypothetical protein